MKARLFFALAAFALTLAATAGNAAAASCTSYCAIVRCLDGYTCGPYVNSSGQTVCGCHPSPFR
ncbi:MAG TPA: hypothetical protein VJ725_19310 [Thermoanaerobaculia bacterium]|nr:hypothetical protein [Thermoanaerobaculia bacterium]